jgi:DNA-binding transcriptional regulator PaaX
MPPAKISDQLLLSYFANLPKRFGPAYDATTLRYMANDSPWKEMLENGEINRQNMTNILLRMTQRGHLQRRGHKKSSVYRISDKGYAYLKELEGG